MPIESKDTLTPAAQEVCINLPGESVQCWRSSDRIKVILRKHRDVIINIKLGAGKNYTVESSKSEFYNARDKKLVARGASSKVSFQDGERLHLWVTRDFEGCLSIKSEGKLVMRLQPNEIDQHAYDADPKTKAAPIIINLGNASGSNSSIPGITPIAKKNETSVQKYMTPPVAASVNTDECSVVCVVEGALKGAPDAVLTFFKKGGGKSGLVDIDPYDVATRNWLLGQLAGTAAYARDNWSWLKETIEKKPGKWFQLVKVKAVHVRGKIRFYFSGYTKFNTAFGPGGFGPAHDRIVTILAGAGKTSSSFLATVKGVAGSFKGNALVSFIFGSATAVAEWKDDAQKDGYDLTSALLMSVVKAIVAAAIVVVVVAAFVMLALALGAATVPVIVVGAVTVAAGFVINYAVESADKALGRVVTGDAKNSDGLSTAITPYLRKAGKQIEETWNYLMEKFPTDYSELTF